MGVIKFLGIFVIMCGIVYLISLIWGLPFDENTSIIIQAISFGCLLLFGIIISFTNYDGEDYEDGRGYERDKYGRLVHRKIAYGSHYKYGNYSKKFGEYVVHHKDGNKKNNSPDNLEILTKEEHKIKHGIR